MLNNALCVCCTAATYNSSHLHWQKASTEFGTKFLCIDKTKNKSLDVGFSFTEEDLVKNFNFNKSVPKSNYWNPVGNRNIAWFYAHLRMLNFYIHEPNWDYYWFFDDDIKMKNWELFFSGTNTSTKDFLAYFCFKHQEDNAQPGVPVIDSNTHSGPGWFLRFPGSDSVMPTDATSYYGSFFPTTRFSKKALQTLLDMHNQGYYGYHEGLVPTLLNYKGLTLQTIIKPDNTSDFFDTKEVHILHKDCLINWSWI